MSIQFFHPETSAVFSSANDLDFKGKSANALKKVARNIPSSKDLSGVELRLLPPYIIENNTTPIFPFPGFAKLYCMTIVVSDANNQLVGGIDLQGFPRIGDKENLPINKTIFYWEQLSADKAAPSQIHAMCSVIKSKAGLREAGKIMADLKKDEEYKSITKTLAGLAKGAAAGVALDIISQVAGIVGKYLGNVEDKPLGTIINSFTALRGDFDQTGIQKRTYPTRNVNFELELIVRDKTAVSAAPVAAASTMRGGAKAKPKAAFDESEEVVVDMMPLK